MSLISRSAAWLALGEVDLGLLNAHVFMLLLVYVRGNAGQSRIPGCYIFARMSTVNTITESFLMSLPLGGVSP